VNPSHPVTSIESLRITLEQLHSKIDECTVCATEVVGYEKVRGVRRGDPGQIIIIGQGPGNREKAVGRAFAGQSGTSLDRWLVASGADPADPRRGIYLTSVTKCIAAQDSGVRMMARKCRPWLLAQLQTITPELIITLGEHAYRELDMSRIKYNEAVCIPQSSQALMLFSSFGVNFTLLPWPHPSGLNRWHNLEKNRAKLAASFDVVRPFFR
jgi:uracil-DNA glycosylase family 4